MVAIAPGAAEAETFGDLLRRHRPAAGLTQEDLAERAGLGVRTIQELERGVARPLRRTAQALVHALALPPAESAAFEAAATPAPRRRPRSTQPVEGSPAPTRIKQADQSDPAAGHLTPTSLAAEDEYKQATVLSCQMVNTAGLSECLGPDALLDLMHHLLQEAAQEVARYEGTVSAVLGDGLVALFGVPLAHEDHARRAVLAALGIQRRLEVPLTSDHPRRARRTVRLSDHLRIGLHTGWIAVARLGPPQDRRATAVGTATAVASAIQQAARRGRSSSARPPRDW